MEDPKIILLISGKRKCGKDYLADKLRSIFKGDCAIVRISEPIKKSYALEHNLDLVALLGDGPYKERYRLDMINWSDNVRAVDPSFFCKTACDTATKTHVWIVSDIRRKTDIQYFKETFQTKVKTVRIDALPSVRESRGWKCTIGVDDVTSECDLDKYEPWDLHFSNNSSEDFKILLNEVMATIQRCL